MYEFNYTLLNNKNLEKKNKLTIVVKYFESYF